MIGNTHELGAITVSGAECRGVIGDTRELENDLRCLWLFSDVVGFE